MTEKYTNIFQPTNSQLRKMSKRRPSSCKSKSCHCSCHYFDDYGQGFCFGINLEKQFDCVTLCQCFPETIDGGKLKWSEQNMHPAEAIWIAGALALVAQGAIQMIPEYRDASNKHVRGRHNAIRKHNKIEKDGK
jgi:hypothetical protein